MRVCELLIYKLINKERVMRKAKGRVPHVAAIIEEDLENRNMGLEKLHIKNLADIAVSILAVQEC